MNKVSFEPYRQAVEGLHDCQATYKEKTYVTETIEDESVWDGDVYIFDLEGHPKAEIAYAWSSHIKGSNNRQFYAVLHIPPVQSAQDAVRAAILRDYGNFLRS